MCSATDHRFIGVSPSHTHARTNPYPQTQTQVIRDTQSHSEKYGERMKEGGGINKECGVEKEEEEEEHGEK